MNSLVLITLLCLLADHSINALLGLSNKSFRSDFSIKISLPFSKGKGSSGDKVNVEFLPSLISIKATIGQPLSAVAEEALVPIQYKC